jgi:hypothetical protein
VVTVIVSVAVPTTVRAVVPIMAPITVPTIVPAVVPITVPVIVPAAAPDESETSEHAQPRPLLHPQPLCPRRNGLRLRQRHPAPPARIRPAPRRPGPFPRPFPPPFRPCFPLTLP